MVGTALVESFLGEKMSATIPRLGLCERVDNLDYAHDGRLIGNRARVN